VATFSGTFINKVDRKGRVSVPASFRTVLSTLGQQSIAAFPNPTGTPALDCCGADWLDKVGQLLGSKALYQAEYEAIAYLILGAAQPLSLDPEGRILLPQGFIEHTGVTDSAAFIGIGERFQIWTPASLKKMTDEARANLAANIAKFNELLREAGRS